MQENGNLEEEALRKAMDSMKAKFHKGRTKTSFSHLFLEMLNTIEEASSHLEETQPSRKSFFIFS